MEYIIQSWIFTLYKRGISFQEIEVELDLLLCIHQRNILLFAKKESGQMCIFMNIHLLNCIEYYVKVLKIHFHVLHFHMKERL